MNTFGIKGELKIESYTDFPEERFKKGTMIYFGEKYLPFEIRSYRSHKGFILLALKDYEDINLVEKFKGMDVYKSLDDIEPLKDGEYYFSDLKNLDVYIDEECIGKVIAVEEGVTHNNLRVLKNEDNKEYLIPFIPVFIRNVDLDNNRVVINYMEGLI